MSKHHSTPGLDQIKAVNGFDSEVLICWSCPLCLIDLWPLLTRCSSSNIHLFSSPMVCDLSLSSWLTTGVSRDLHLHLLHDPDSAHVMSVRLLLVLVLCPCAEDVPPLMELSPGPLLSGVWREILSSARIADTLVGVTASRITIHGSEMTGWWQASAWWSRSIHFFTCSCPRVWLYQKKYYL